MNLNRFLKVAALIALLSAGSVGVRHLWRELAFHLTASGARGCGIATITVVSDGAEMDVPAGLDTLRLIGREVTAADLIDRFNQRIANVPPGPEVWRNHRLNRSEYELILAANLLIGINDPRARGLFVRMLDDPYFVSRTIDWITELGDSRACPALLESWKKRPGYPYVYINAFRELPYKPAIPYVIEAFRPNMTHYSIEYLFQTLEVIADDSLQEYRGGSLNSAHDVEALKEELHHWWSQRSSAG